MTSMKEVAKRAGVSIATVSAVINDNKFVSAELKVKIEEAIKELNYRPNRIARSLKGKETKLIGVMVTEITNPFYPLMIKGIEDLALTAGFNILLSTTSDDEKTEYKLIESILDQGVDGVVLATIDNSKSKSLELLKKENIPTVLINRAPKNYPGSKIYVDSYKVGSLATEYLLQLGHKKIAFFGGKRQNTKEREKAFLDVMKSRNLPVPNEWIIDSEYNFEKVKCITKEIIKNKDRPTAIYAGMDIIAFEVAKAILEEGLRIPEDISIVGSDNIPFSEDFRVPLTSVDVQAYEIGKRGLKILIDKITNKEEEVQDQVIFDPTLVIRNSTAELSSD